MKIFLSYLVFSGIKASAFRPDLSALSCKSSTKNMSSLLRKFVFLVWENIEDVYVLFKGVNEGFCL